MRWVLAAVTTCLIALTGCTGTTPEPIGLVRPSSSSGVRGDISYVGGPVAVSQASPIWRPGSVTASTLDGVQRGRVAFPEGQGFTLPLPPGTYRSVSKSGDAQCPAQIITVIAGRYSTVNIRCSVK